LKKPEAFAPVIDVSKRPRFSVRYGYFGPFQKGGSRNF
jgi:hypothetical protein